MTVAADDRDRFGPESVPALRRVTSELSWLLGRGYPLEASLKLVGDRHALDKRQRHAVARCAAPDEVVAARLRSKRSLTDLAGRHLAIDGFNVIILLETALRGGVLVRGRDTALRDLAGMRGSYRVTEATDAALRALADVLSRTEVATVTLLLDAPVSHSGRLAARLRDVGRDLPWTVEVTRRVDERLAAGDHVVATSDGWVLDRASEWIDLAGAVLTAHGDDALLVDLGYAPDERSA